MTDKLIESIESIVVVSGLVLGSLIILAVIFSYLKGRKIGSTDLLLALIGVVLVSLSLWQTMKISSDGKGVITAEVKRLEKNIANNTGTISDSTKNLNSQVGKLNLTVEQLIADVTALKQKNPGIQPSQEESNTRKQEEARRQKEEEVFQNNAKYSVFVFYRSDRRQDATNAVQALSEAGYGSSMILTDLAEATNQQSKGTTSVIYTESGKASVQDVERILRSLGLGESIKIEPQRPELGRGDINIHMF